MTDLDKLVAEPKVSIVTFCIDATNIRAQRTSDRVVSIPFEMVAAVLPELQSPPEEQCGQPLVIFE